MQSKTKTWDFGIERKSYARTEVRRTKSCLNLVSKSRKNF